MDEPQYDSGKSKLELRQFYREQVARATNFFQQGEYDIVAGTLKHFARYENVPPFDEGMVNLYQSRLPEKTNNCKLAHLRAALKCFCKVKFDGSEREVDEQTIALLVKVAEDELAPLVVIEQREAAERQAELARAKEKKEAEIRDQIVYSTRLILGRVLAPASKRAADANKQ